MQEQELIFVDYEKIKRINNLKLKCEKEVNEFYRLALKTLGHISLTDPNAFVRSPLEYFDQELKSRYKFPDADAEFNNKALGINPNPVIERFTQIIPREIEPFGKSVGWEDFNFTFQNGEFRATEDQPLINECYYYADTPERRKLIKLARKTIDTFNELSKAGFIRKPSAFWDSFDGGIFNGNGDISTSRSIARVLEDADKKKYNL